jgi:hypothetical protein
MVLGTSGMIYAQVLQAIKYQTVLPSGNGKALTIVACNAICLSLILIYPDTLLNLSSQ